MQPDSANPDPYGFIVNNPPKPPRKNPFAGLTTKMRIIVIVGGLVVVLIFGMLLSSLFNQGSKAQTQRMIDVATIQSEIVRVSTIAEKEVRSSSTLDYASTTRLSVQSSQVELAKKLDKRGVGQKKLAKLQEQAKNQKSDQALDEAKSSNRYDETYLKIINEALSNYQKSLVAASGGASKSENQILRTAWEGVETLKKNDPAASGDPRDIQIDKSKPEEDTPKSSIIDNDLGSSPDEE